MAELVAPANPGTAAWLVGLVALVAPGNPGVLAEVVDSAGRVLAEGKVMSGGSRSASNLSAKAAVAKVKQTAKTAIMIALRKIMCPVRIIAFVLQQVAPSIVMLSKNNRADIMPGGTGLWSKILVRAGFLNSVSFIGPMFSDSRTLYSGIGRSLWCLVFTLCMPLLVASRAWSNPTTSLDPVDSVYHSLVYYVALKKAGVPVEMHLYAQGGHAFGLRPTKLPVSRWPRLVETRLGTIGMIPETTEK